MTHRLPIDTSLSYGTRYQCSGSWSKERWFHLNSTSLYKQRESGKLRLSDQRLSKSQWNGAKRSINFLHKFWGVEQLNGKIYGMYVLDSMVRLVKVSNKYERQCGKERVTKVVNLYAVLTVNLYAFFRQCSFHSGTTHKKILLSEFCLDQKQSKDKERKPRPPLSLLRAS